MTAIVRPAASSGPQGPTGPTGAQGTASTVAGPTGPAGTAGTRWWTGSGLPDDADGTDGDLYLRLDTGDIWQRVGGTWGA